MNYPLTLDEIPLEKLREEINRRMEARLSCLCDYCGRGRDDPPCKFPGRHDYQNPVFVHNITDAELQAAEELLGEQGCLQSEQHVIAVRERKELPDDWLVEQILYARQ